MRYKAKYFATTSKFYDTVYEKLRSPVDKKFYLEEILNCDGKILEIGCGTGRIFVDALRAGADIYGIDASRNMIKILKQKIEKKDHYRVSVADARRVNFDMTFDLIIAPFRVFSHMFTIADQQSFLKCAKSAMNENAKLIIDLFYPKPDLIHHPTKTLMDFEGEYKPGKKLRRYVTIEPDPVEQINNLITVFEWDEDSGIKKFREDFSMRYFYKFEMIHLLKSSGLKVNEIYGDFERNKLVSGKWEQLFICSPA
ncbi:MAG: class I SAM-dependent methyltransferase [Ignavibacteriaceae bacterium]|nr:class I SAM-dependent methyltransferase [Ignavibacteriaceae bacterium]